MEKSNQIFAAASATVGAFGLGTVLAWTSPALESMQKESEEFKEISKESQSWVGAILTLGALFSAPVCGVLMDRIGRKNTMLILSVPFVLGWLLIGYAQNLAMMLCGRFISGFCGGGFSLVAPVFIGETAEDSIRGALGSGFQLMVVLGILFVNTVGSFADWQWLSLICGFVPLVFLISMIFVQESPRYLLMKGKNADASQSLCWFRKKTSSQEVEDELKIIEISVNESKAEKAKFSDLALPHNLRPSLIMMALMLFQQLSGINAVIFYTTNIFKAAGSDLDGNVSSIIVAGIQVVATLAAVFVVDKLGRRILLTASALIMCIALVALGLFFHLQENGNAKTIGWLPLVSLMVFISAFSIGFGPLPWMMLGELLPPKVKGLVASVATMFNWFLAFLVTKFYQNLLDAVGAPACYWGFAGVCAVGTAFIILIIPETKGKSIDEIQKLFGAPTVTDDSEESRK
ncbi:facilitated trehalose transporter Tret1-2 homolog [Folsomia candida]|uniref:Facilitated trehalose transporter Tret1 n=1 Tax=Folsomia candida TaxID=158441 RepID=A0A226F053_FOLCA|nr:facilitated trehalose transporter Tret1-2 homolog [Folsomia candida]XP_021951388.1 facilitated trehalose transporter Tret1-2 homolog [Folsomia candida]OXA62848.1 Facilitated trehalose transporter Tret1 [Folsomia candida]